MAFTICYFLFQNSSKHSQGCLVKILAVVGGGPSSCYWMWVFLSLIFSLSCISSFLWKVSARKQANNWCWGEHNCQLREKNGNVVRCQRNPVIIIFTPLFWLLGHTDSCCNRYHQHLFDFWCCPTVFQACPGETIVEEVPERLKNDHPVSNLLFSSKVLMHVVLSQLMTHPEIHNFLELFQLACRKCHNTEIT